LELDVSAKAEFLNLIDLNPVVREIVDRVSVLELLDTWLVSGCLFQTVWTSCGRSSDPCDKGLPRL
jgi:hypothetical protein